MRPSRPADDGTYDLTLVIAASKDGRWGGKGCIVSGGKGSSYRGRSGSVWFTLDYLLGSERGAVIEEAGMGFLGQVPGPVVELLYVPPTPRFPPSPQRHRGSRAALPAKGSVTSAARRGCVVYDTTGNEVLTLRAAGTTRSRPSFGGRPREYAPVCGGGDGSGRFGMRMVE